MQRDSILTAEHLNLYYGENQALRDISVSIPRNRVTALIGPSGCGKSTLLRCFNRLNDLVEGVRIEGGILLRAGISTTQIAMLWSCGSESGWSFRSQTPSSSIYDNVAYGPRVHGVRDRKVLTRSSGEPGSGCSLGRGGGPAPRLCDGAREGSSSGSVSQGRSRSSPR